MPTRQINDSISTIGSVDDPPNNKAFIGTILSYLANNQTSKRPTRLEAERSEEVRRLFIKYSELEFPYHIMALPPDAEKESLSEAALPIIETYTNPYTYPQGLTPGSLLCPNRLPAVNEYGGSRSVIVEIDDQIDAKDRVSMYLGTGTHLLREWQAPDTSPAFMAFILNKEILDDRNTRGTPLEDTLPISGVSYQAARRLCNLSIAELKAFRYGLTLNTNQKGVASALGPHEIQYPDIVDARYIKRVGVVDELYDHALRQLKVNGLYQIASVLTPRSTLMREIKPEHDQAQEIAQQIITLTK